VYTLILNPSFPRDLDNLRFALFLGSNHMRSKGLGLELIKAISSPIKVGASSNKCPGSEATSGEASPSAAVVPEIGRGASEAAHFWQQEDKAS
jgi:hypothetical protein